MIAKYYDTNWNELDTRGLITTHLNIPSTNFENVISGGVDGIPPFQNGTNILQKQITATIELVSYNYLDYQLLRDHLYAIFGYNKIFYVVDTRQPFKYHKVKLDNNFMPTRHNAINGTAEVNFVTVDEHYAISIGTTQDIEQNGIDADSKLWGFGMGLIADDESLKYTHAGTTFRIYNAGNVPIHPYEQKLNIKVINAFNSTEYLEIINKTNGNVFRLNEGLSNTSVLEIDGPNVTLNGLQAYRKTNRKFIQLEPGWNEFEIKGVSSARIEFDFPFYYK